MLFGSNDITKKPSGTSALTALSSVSTDSFSVLGRKVDVLASFDNLRSGTHLHFCTQGKWSSHEMLAKLLTITGSAEVCLTSWALTEDPVRMLVQMKQAGIITEMFMVVDKRIKVHNPIAYQLAEANFDKLKLANIHAKVITIRNTDWNLTVLNSANFTRNKRFEAGAVIDDEKMAAFHSSWIKSIVNDELV